MLNGTRPLKVLWMVLSGVLILVWAVIIFQHAGVERTMAATAGMLLGVLLFSVNAAALLEELLAPGDPASH